MTKDTIETIKVTQTIKPVFGGIQDAEVIAFIPYKNQITSIIRGFSRKYWEVGSVSAISVRTKFGMTINAVRATSDGKTLEVHVYYSENSSDTYTMTTRELSAKLRGMCAE